MPITTLIFDWDQTLVNSWGVHRDAIQHAARSLGLDVPSEQVLVTTFTGSLEEQLVTLFDRADWVMDLYLQYYWAHHKRGARLFPGIRRLVRGLRARGIQMGLLSNKMRRTAVAELEVTGLLDAFDLMVFRDDLGSLKPDPEGLNALLEGFRASPQECLLVGDGPTDVQVAHRVGAPSAAALWGSLDHRAVLAEGPHLAWQQVSEAAHFCATLRD